MQAKGCRGKGRSCNNDHGAWSWRKASKPGVLDADSPNKKGYDGPNIKKVRLTAALGMAWACGQQQHSN